MVFASYVRNSSGVFQFSSLLKLVRIVGFATSVSKKPVGACKPWHSHERVAGFCLFINIQSLMGVTHIAYLEITVRVKVLEHFPKRSGYTVY